MPLNASVVDYIKTIYKEGTLPEQALRETLAVFYEGDTFHYMDHMVEAWNQTPELDAEHKAAFYIGFVGALPLKKHQLLDVQLDQISNLTGVLTKTEQNQKLNADVIEKIVNGIDSSSIDPILKDFINATLREYSTAFNDRSNAVNIDYVQRVLRLNQSPMFTPPQNEDLNMYQYMNAFMVHRAIYSMFNIEKKAPHTFSDADIDSLRQAELRTMNEMSAGWHISTEWNLALIHYLHHGDNIEQLKSMYYANEQKQKAWDEDLAIADISLLTEAGMAL